MRFSHSVGFHGSAAKFGNVSNEEEQAYHGRQIIHPIYLRLMARPARMPVKFAWILRDTKPVR